MIKVKDNKNFTQGAFMADSMAKALGGAPKKKTWGQDEYLVKTGDYKEVSIKNAGDDGFSSRGEADNTHDVFRTKSDALDKKDELGAADSDDELFGDVDQEFERLRVARAHEMVAQGGKIMEYRRNGHGEYRTVSQDEFLPAVTKSKFAICHIFHHEFERCKLMDKLLGDMSKRFLPTRFIRLDAEKSPFFVDKLRVQILPTVVLFKDGVAIDRVLGFAGVGDESDDVTERDLINRFNSGPAKGVLRSLNKAGEERDGDSEDEANERARRNRIRASARGATFDDDAEDDE